MDKKWLHIALNVMPWEIDKFELLVHKFNSSKYYLKPNHRVTFTVSMNVSSEYTDWEQSKLPREFFVDKFNSLTPKLNWWSEKNLFYVEDDNSLLGIKGCSDIRRKVVAESDPQDYILWLDPDIYFSDITLACVFNSIQALEENKQKGYKIITPEIVRYWDESWDCLVNEEFVDNELGQLYNFDVYEIDNFVFKRSNKDFGLRMLPNVKFGGGLFTTYSADLLKFIEFSEELGAYGYEDSYALHVCNAMKQMGYDINQYVLSDVLIAEDKKFLFKATADNESCDDRIQPYGLVYNDYLTPKQKTDDIRKNIKELCEGLTKERIERLQNER